MNLSQISEAYAAGRITTAEAIGALERLAGTAAPLPLSEGQKGLWALYRMEPSMTAYNVPIAVRCATSIDPDRMRLAFERVCGSHALLKSRVARQDGMTAFVPSVEDAEGMFVVEPCPVAAEEARALLHRHALRPFDLERGPAIRCVLLRAESGAATLMVVAHHIVMDGTSSMLFLSQLLRTYAALIEGTAPHVEPDAHYRDFVQWEVAWLDSDAGRQARSYWMRQLQGVSPVSGMPTVAPWTHAALRSPGRVVRRALPPALVEALSALATERGLSRGVLFLAAFKIALFRYTGQTDLTVGMPFIGRPQARFDQVIGHFINMLPIRSRIEGSQSADDAAAALQRTVVEAIDHAAYPFPRLVADLGARDPNLSSPVFQISFNYQNFADLDWVSSLQKDVASALRFELDGELVQAGEYELCLDVLPAEGHALCFKYQPDVYADGTVEALAGHYVQILRAMVEAPAQRIDRIPMIDEAERRQLLRLGERAPHAWPERDLTFHDLFLRQVEARPDAPAATCAGDTLTYRELEAASAAVAAGLARAGVEAGGKVGLCVQRSMDMLVGLLAIARVGASYIPLDPEYPADRLAHMVDDSGCRTLLTQQALRDRLDAVFTREGVAVLTFDQVTDDAGTGRPAARTGRTGSRRARPRRGRAADALAYTIYTSGSTGKPKGVMISHGALTNFLLSIRDTLSFGAHETLLAVTTLSFDIAALELYLPLITGGHCVICEADTARDAARLKDTLREVRPTTMQATPMTWLMLFKVGWRNEENTRLLCGGEAMSEKLRQQFMACGADVWNMYGPTETTIWSTVQHLRPDQPVSIGAPIHNTSAYILDAQLEPVPVGVPGELMLAGDGVAVGYHNRPELTAEKFIDNPHVPGQRMYRTGDLARWRADGGIDVLGRIDQQVKVNGFRIELGEIENALNAHAAIENSAVIVRKGAGADRLCACYVARANGAAAGDVPDAKALQAHLKSTLPDYMIPAEWMRLPQFPLTPNGKVDRLALAAMQQASQQVSQLEPQTKQASAPAVQAVSKALEQQVLGIFRDVLGRQTAGRDERFFDAGGDSYSAILVVEKVNAALGCEITTTMLFKHPTAAALAAALQEQFGETAPATDDAASFATTETGAVASSRPSAVDAEEVPEDAVAIVGISCQFPGARDTRAFWEALVNGQDCIRLLPPEDLRGWGLEQALLEHADFVPQQASIDGKDLFDPAFFNISPRDASFMDPQARLLLMHAWKAVEDAGYSVDDIPDTSVFMSAGNNFYQAQWTELLANTTQVRVMQSADEYVAWLLAQGGSLPTMVSNKLGLTGPSVYVSTNCSSSLTGLHLACQGLVTGEVDQALVGAAGIFPAQSLGYVHQPGLNFSSDGHCRAFDADADGMVGGEGVAVVMLKRARDALRDGDPVYAMVRGTAINNDGADKAGFYAPSIQGQTAVIRKVLDKTGIDPGTICYVEAHGTGTRIGDPIEISGLSDAYRHYTGERQFCAIGSVKSNIGHLDAAAGLAGLTKLALSLQHGVIPRTLHFNRPNPQIDFEASPFYVLTENMRLPQGAAPARVALSSFGIGGTNGHAILEQAPAPAAQADEVDSTVGGLFVLSAQNAARLKQRAADMFAFLPAYRSGNGRLCDLLHTLQVGRRAMDYRLAFPVDSLDDLERKLSVYLAGTATVPGSAEGDAKSGGSGLAAMFEDGDEAAMWASTWARKRQWQKLGTLWVHGLAIDWRAIDTGGSPRRVHLPTYPFAEKSFWLAQAPRRSAGTGSIDALAGALGAQAMAGLERIAGPDGPARMLQRRSVQTAQLNAVLAKVLLTQLRRAGLFADATPLGLQDIVRTLGLGHALERWMHRSLHVLAEAGHLHVSQGRYALVAAAQAEDAWSEWDAFKREGGGTPETAGRVPLLEAMLGALPRILAGEVPATQVMFPESSHTLVEGVYKHNTTADYFNALAAEAAHAFVESLRAHAPQAKIRILEIGAGTGSTSEHMFRRLADVAGHIAEYVYTDLSKAFLVQAQNRFAATVPYLRCAMFDVEKSPGAQGFAAGGFDLVIATNVLHATRNMRRSLGHVKALLRTDGLLLVNEIVENDLSMHLTFGLLEGWWKYDDPDDRLPGGPALSAARWRTLLAETGFHTVLLPAQSAEAMGLQLIVAQSDGRTALPDDARNGGHPADVDTARTQATRTMPAAAAPRPAAMSAATHADEDAGPHARVVHAIVAELCSALQLEPEEVTHHVSFADYGLDSLTGVNLVKQLNQALGIRLEVTTLFDYPTVEKLKAYIVAQFGAALAVDRPEPDAAMAPADAPIARGLSSASRPATAGHDDAIAIVGLSGRFPGTDDVDTFWDHLVHGRDLVETARRWDLERHGARCRAGGFLTDIAYFDPLFFNISGLEADYMEPQQRIFLEEAWKALENAGYAGQGMDQRRCGVYVGCANGDYLDLASEQSYPAQAFWGNMSSIVPARISYYLNLHGPALAIDTACSSSLVAIHQACQALRADEIEMAIAGGVFVQCSPRLYIAGTRAGMLSPSGRCRSFDDGADGFVPSEGAGALILKRLGDAIADGDHIHGVVRASAINQDGTTNGISAPSAVSQQRLLEQVYDEHGIDCESIQMVEAHGTGTKLGDPIEFQALARAFRGRTDRVAFCALGSSKANIGHAQMAAGVIGIIKILLAMKHRQIPPLALFERANANIALEGSPFFINTEALPWTAERGPRRAVVSSFGASGTNAHLVIEEAPQPRARASTAGTAEDPQLLVLTARTEAQLRVQAERMRDHCRSVRGDLALGDIAHTLLVGRRHLGQRLAIVASSVAEYVGHLSAWLEGEARDHACILHSASGARGPSQPAGATDAHSPRARDCMAQARAFVEGRSVDGAALFANQDVRRIPLPGHVFEREYHWADIAVSITAAQAAPERDAAHLAVRHVQGADAHEDADALQFDVVLDADAYYFRDHRVLGEAILPVPVYLEMGRRAALHGADDDTPAAFRIGNLVLLRPLSSTQQQVRVVRTRDDRGTLDGGRFESNTFESTTFESTTFEVRSASAEAAGGEVLHCRGEFQPMPVEAPAIVDLAALRAGATAQDIGSFYADYARLGIAYGPAFQGVKAVHVRDDGVLVHLALPAVVADTLQDMPIHPVLFDCAMQCLKWLPDATADAGRARLMFAIRDIRVHAPCAPVMWAWIRHAQGPQAGRGVTGKVDVDLCDAHGRVCVAIRGVSTRTATPAAAPDARNASMPSQVLSEVPMATAHTAKRLLPVWTPLEDARGPAWPSPSERVAIVGASPGIEAVWRKALPELLALDVERIASLSLSGPPLDHVVWVAPAPGPAEAAPDADAVIAAQERGTLALLRLVKALVAAGHGRRELGLTVLMRGAHAAQPAEAFDPTHAGVAGLIGSVAKEYPAWRVRAVDMHDGAPDGVFDDTALRDLLACPPERDGNTRLYRGRRWLSQRLMPVDGLAVQGSAFKQGGLYVIVGGAGGLGRAISAHLMRRYGARIVWIGRSARDAGIERQLAALPSGGAGARYVQADATDAASMRRARAWIAEHLGPVNGLVQSALVLQGASIERMSESQFTDVLRTKVDASLRMVEAFREDPLDLVLFVSSINSYLKAMGHANYAAGCAFKDALALRLAQTMPFAAKVINLGYCFNNAGSDRAPAAIDGRGLDFITEDELMAGLDTLCASDTTQMTLMKFFPSQNTRGITVGPAKATAEATAHASVPHPDAEASLGALSESLIDLDDSATERSGPDLDSIIDRMQALNALVV